MRCPSKNNPLLWPNGSHIIAFVTRYVFNEWLSLFQTCLDHIELFELWTSDLPASLGDSGGLVRDLCASVVWDFKGACFLLGIRILEHNTDHWDWMTKNAWEEVCACVCVWEVLGSASWHCRVFAKRACWIMELLVGFMLLAKVTVADSYANTHEQ